ncbi:hypothetical protein BDR26DRAFT_858747 [Obelidium mucronatum]|nr:hypothetical protein BDR26DRAFT_858747 [Obelidium mucronatum]
MAWKLITGAFLLASVAFAGDCTPGEAGASCMTSGGSWLTIISPFANSNAVVGQDLTVTWGVCGNDPSFLYGNVTFEIADATNPNNVQTISGGQIISSTPVSVGTVTVKVPLTLAATATGKYTIKSSYRDDLFWKHFHHNWRCGSTERERNSRPWKDQRKRIHDSYSGRCAFNWSPHALRSSFYLQRRTCEVCFNFPWASLAD